MRRNMACLSEVVGRMKEMVNGDFGILASFRREIDMD